MVLSMPSANFANRATTDNTKIAKRSPSTVAREYAPRVSDQSSRFRNTKRARDKGSGARRGLKSKLFCAFSLLYHMLRPNKCLAIA